jgi:DNA-binding NarL/FixJ family response regulator
MKSLNPNPVNRQKAESCAGSRPEYPIKVAIVDDDENDRLMMRNALEQSGEFVCVGAYRSANEALAEIPRILPHAVLMDIRMPGLSGIECARQLKQLLPDLVVIFVTGLLDATTLSESVQAGGDDYLVKPLVVAQCMATICFALDRCRGRTARTQTGSARGLLLLTESERAVLDGLVTGLLYKEIAIKLHTTEAMVHKLQHSIFSKLQVSNRSEAIALFFRKERPD